ncbi:hypothetical protein CYJ70_03670 [Gardnerella pickettii]|uniref:Uncharacterized protein n=1 Tax=Gardnerella pickettii TaxID=2914924 RepID=A0ABX4SKZ3_9BIFI|nr:hypothetical protein CYJ70_03670 [Gardnerella pickettii]
MRSYLPCSAFVPKIRRVVIQTHYINTQNCSAKRLEHFVPGHTSIETKCSMHFVSNAAACLLIQSA